MQIMFLRNLKQTFVCWYYFKELHNATYSLIYARLISLKLSHKSSFITVLRKGRQKYRISQNDARDFEISYIFKYGIKLVYFCF
jgi:hypothetical protein